MTELPDVKNVFQIIYLYKTPSTGVREFYLEGEEVKKFFSQIGGASIMGITHGLTFEKLNWKVRKRSDRVG